jgi:non-specific serine/threonine protein kinase
MVDRSFGHLLQEFRAAAGLTQQELAELADLSSRGISDLERGARRSPRPVTVRQLAAALQLDQDEHTALTAAANPSRNGQGRTSTPRQGGTATAAALTSFVGRDREQADVLHALLSNRLVTLTGLGGIGKTRLAVAVAARYSRAASIVELASEGDAHFVAPQFAAALHIRVPGRERAEDALLAELANAQLLIVVDNCEHLLGACKSLIGVLLERCPGLRFLATSREPLALPDEIVWPVPPLSVGVADDVTVHRLARYSAVQLFVDRARAVWPSFALSGANAAAIARVCQRLEGIPLAIELAAARTRVLSVEQIDARLADRYRLLTMGSADAPARHRSLQAAVEWSYGLLSAREQLLFQRMAVFRGGASLEAVEAVCGLDTIDVSDVTDVLQSLVEKSLVVARPEADGSVRFAQLETLREFAHARSLERGECDSLRARHLTYHAQLAERMAPDLRARDQVGWLDCLQSEHDNIRAALDWATSAIAAVEDGLRLATATAAWYAARGNVDEGLRWLDALLARGVAAQPAIRGKALGAAGMLASDSGDYDRARPLHEEALAIMRQLGDRRGVSAQLNLLSIVETESGDVAAAGVLLEQSLALSRELDDQPAIARAYCNLGINARLRGQLDDAREYFVKAIDMHQVLGARPAIAFCLHGLGNVARDGGDLAKAGKFFREALALADETRDWPMVTRCFESLASTLVMQRRNLPRAAQLFGAAEVLREQTGVAVSGTGRARRDQVLGQLERSLGSATMAAAWQRGRALSRHRAVELAIGNS